MPKLDRKVRIHAVSLPDDTLVSALRWTDYADAYGIDVPPTTFPDVDAFARAFLGAAPAWADRLMQLRNRMVRLIGLKTSARVHGGSLAMSDLRPGARAGIFRIIERTDEEILAGEDDRHLDFRVSLLLRQKAESRHATVSTVVRFHGRLGRAYFALVRPFHRLIVPAMLRRAPRVAPSGSRGPTVTL